MTTVKLGLLFAQMALQARMEGTPRAIQKLPKVYPHSSKRQAAKAAKRIAKQP